MACVSNGGRPISGGCNTSDPHPGLHPRNNRNLQETEKGGGSRFDGETDGFGDDMAEWGQQLAGQKQDAAGHFDLGFQNDGQMIENRVEYTLELAASLGGIIWGLQE